MQTATLHVDTPIHGGRTRLRCPDCTRYSNININHVDETIAYENEYENASFLILNRPGVNVHIRCKHCGSDEVTYLQTRTEYVPTHRIHVTA